MANLRKRERTAETCRGIAVGISDPASSKLKNTSTSTSQGKASATLSPEIHIVKKANVSHPIQEMGITNTNKALPLLEVDPSGWTEYERPSWEEKNPGAGWWAYKGPLGHWMWDTLGTWGDNPAPFPEDFSAPVREAP